MAHRTPLIALLLLGSCTPASSGPGSTPRPAATPPPSRAHARARRAAPRPLASRADMAKRLGRLVQDLEHQAGPRAFGLRTLLAKYLPAAQASTFPARAAVTVLRVMNPKVKPAALVGAFVEVVSAPAKRCTEGSAAKTRVYWLALRSGPGGATDISARPVQTGVFWGSAPSPKVIVPAGYPRIPILAVSYTIPLCGQCPDERDKPEDQTFLEVFHVGNGQLVQRLKRKTAAESQRAGMDEKTTSIVKLIPGSGKIAYLAVISKHELSIPLVSAPGPGTPDRGVRYRCERTVDVYALTPAGACRKLSPGQVASRAGDTPGLVTLPQPEKGTHDWDCGVRP